MGTTHPEKKKKFKIEKKYIWMTSDMQIQNNVSNMAEKIWKLNKLAWNIESFI